MKKDWLLFTAVFFVSLTVLAFEVVINRLFGLTYWYHFAFLIISIALFGIGFGGLTVFFLNPFLKKESSIVLSSLSLLLGFLLPFTIMIINRIPLEMEKISGSPYQQFLFIKLFFFLSLPFIIAGFIFSFTFTNYKEDIGKIYLFDLFGGGIGCFATLLIFPNRGPFLTTFIISLCCLIAAILFLFKRFHWFSLILILVFPLYFYCFYSSVQNTEPRVSSVKRNLYPLGKKLYSNWDNFGYTAVHERTANSIEVTTGYATYSHMFNTHDVTDYQSYNGPGLVSDQMYPYLIKKTPDRVGIVGTGSGKDILLALHFGAKNVIGAEYNPTMYNVFMNIFKEYNGNLGHREGVKNYNAEGRYFVKSSKESFDILLFNNAIAIAAVNSGAFTLAEAYLYTVEAIIDYYNHLNPDGILYLSNPYSDYVRFITISREAFHRLGKDEEYKKSILVIDNQDKSYKRCKVLIKRGEFTKEEVLIISRFCDSQANKPQILYSPFGNYSTYAAKLILTDDIEKEYQKAKTEIRPSTDDWPFYSQITKKENAEWNEMKIKKDFYYSAPFLLITTIGKFVLVFSLFFLLLPLIFFNLKGFKTLDNKLSSIFFFASLGLGFMLIEIVMMQKYMLVLGHPIYSFSVVLASLMIFSGIGSLLSDFIHNPYSAIRIALVGILISVLLGIIITHIYIDQLIQFPFFMKTAVIVLLTGISGLFMGFMMPSGIRAVSKVESSIPWLWSINGIFSVLAGFLAITISIQYGFTPVLILSLIIYGLGVLIFCYKLVARG